MGDASTGLGPPVFGYDTWYDGLVERLKIKERFRHWSLRMAETGGHIPISLIFYTQSAPGNWQFEFICPCRLWDDLPPRGTQSCAVKQQKLADGMFECSLCKRAWLIHRWEWSSVSPLNRTYDPRTAYCYLMGSRSRVQFLLDTE